MTIGANSSDASFLNEILSNSIGNNGLLGIDLGSTGSPNPNQSSNPVTDTPNNLQNYPQLSSATLQCNGDLTVDYTLYYDSLTNPQNGIPLSPYLIQFFANPSNRNSESPNITEGLTFIGQTTVNTDMNGHLPAQTYTFTPSACINITDFISATATSQSTEFFETNDTSEFSYNVPVTTQNCPSFLKIEKECRKYRKNSTFIITVTNPTKCPAEQVVITDTVPECFKCIRAKGAPYVINGQTVTATIPSIGAGESIKFIIKANSQCCRRKKITNTASAINEGAATAVTDSCSLCFR